MWCGTGETPAPMPAPTPPRAYDAPFFGCSYVTTAGPVRQSGSFLRGSTADVKTCFETCWAQGHTYAGLQCDPDDEDGVQCYCLTTQTGLTTKTEVLMTTPGICFVPDGSGCNASWSTAGDDGEFEIGFKSEDDLDASTLAYYGLLR